MQAILLLDFACLLNRVSLPRWLPHTPLHRKMITILKIIIIITTIITIILVIKTVMELPNEAFEDMLVAMFSIHRASHLFQ